MFFSPELLSTRDSGFGLLWLAATLGSKSTFKKLPKKSVLTADISGLCDLIARPVEPMALRLSSNLMVGIARVYKVKQELLMTDASTCVSTLKRVAQELRSSGQLQMIQPSVRPSALNLGGDPNAAYILDFDAHIADWDEYLNLEGPDAGRDTDFRHDADREKAAELPDGARADLCTLKEDHGHLLVASLDVSFHDISSSQWGFGLDFSQPLPSSDAMDLGDILGEELVRELGDGWAHSERDARTQTSPVGRRKTTPDLNERTSIQYETGDLNIGDMEIANFDIDEHYIHPVETTPEIFEVQRKRKADTQIDPEDSTAPVQQSCHSPESFVQSLINQDNDLQTGPHEVQDPAPQTRQVKRPRLQLDARTELTDEELKESRIQYVNIQRVLRKELRSRRLGARNDHYVKDLLWGVPDTIKAPNLACFWKEAFKTRVEARAGGRQLDIPPSGSRNHEHGNSLHNVTEPIQVNDTPGLEIVQDEIGFDLGPEAEDWHDQQDQETGFEATVALTRSSEEPGQARRAHSPSISFGDHLLPPALQDIDMNTQQNALFPWDHAGDSSSIAGFDYLGSNLSLDLAETKLRAHSLSLRESSVGHGGSQTGLSPGSFSKASNFVGDDFLFQAIDHEVPGRSHFQHASGEGSSLMSLERNSLNFLEYARMLQKTLPVPGSLTFDAIVPRRASTRHIASAAFYNCLVLATKDLLLVTQTVPYGDLMLSFRV